MIDRRIQRVVNPEPSSDLWGWAVPLPYRALTARWSGAGMPAPPDEVAKDAGRLEHECGYYAALFSFLTYSFGWSRPDKGLLWWYQHGRIRQDERFQLLLDTWEKDGTLLGFLAWLSTKPADFMCAETLAQWAMNRDMSPLRLDAEWNRRLSDARAHEPWSEGADPFHLWNGAHIAAPSLHDAHELRSRARMLDPMLTERTATFVSETIEGWYANLTLIGGQLPQLPNDRSWRIDVYVKPIGFLGTYRRSRATRLWFSGRHLHHVVGN